MSDEYLGLFWKRQKTWSCVASELKKDIEFWRNVTFLFAIFGAVSVTLSVQIESASILNEILAWFGAALLAVIPLISQRKLNSDRSLEWLKARSISEDIKSQLFMFQVKVWPYDRAEFANGLLRDNIEAIESKGNGVLAQSATVQLGEVHAPQINSQSDYVDQRLTRQVEEFYIPRARSMKLTLNRLHRVEMVLAIFGAVLAAASGVWVDSIESNSLNLGVWVAVVTTVSGALAAHIASGRYETLVFNYMLAVSSLESLIASWKGNEETELKDDEWTVFVHKCENTIARQHSSWYSIQKDGQFRAHYERN